MNSRGYTLVEALAAITILGIALAGLLPSFITYLDTNTLSEERTEAVAVAQEAMEALRQAEPGDLPETGNSAVELVTVGNRDYEVVERYCVVDTLCGADTRHVIVEVSYGGQTIYSLESVFTQLR